VQDEINKNKTITANSEQLAALKAQFPSCFDKDGRFRPDKLEDIVRASGADITREGYKLDWLGKSYARLLANLKTETLLAPNAAHNGLPENASSENLLIQGDNLDVLKHLVNAYSEKVKMIYIDPPYNTGSDGFVYNDTRKFTVEELQRLAGVDGDEAKRILDFTNSSSNSHSAWLTFMYPRLYVARELLREDGVIFISIDENEQAQLKLLCDEVFGERNFLGHILWKKKTNGNNMGNIPPVHDYLVGYAKFQNSEDLLHGFPASEEYIAKTYTNPDNDERGRWTTMDLSANHEGPYFKITNPNTKKDYYPSKGRYWVFNEKEVAKRVADGRIIFGKTGKAGPIQKKFYNRVIEEKGEIRFKPESWWDKHGYNSDGTDELYELFEIPKIFVNSKPTSFLKNVLTVSTKDTDIIVDFFSGSASTAHAAMALNAQDGGNRKHISVQLDEPTDEKSEARKAGYNTIFEITRERIKRAAAKIKKDHSEATCDFGFKEFKTIPANEGQFQGYLDDAATREDYEPFNGMALDNDGIQALLTTWAAYDGLPLHQTLQEVDLGGYTAYMGGDKLYFVNSGLGIEHIAAMLTRIDDDATFTPRKIVVFHYRFNDKELREFSEAVNAPNRKHLQLDFIQRF